MKKAAIILPTVNERENISNLIPSIFNQSESLNNWKISIVVVDDFSTDKTAEIVKKLQKKYKNLHLVQKKKEGLGKAYLKGFEYCFKSISPFVIFEMDADWSHNPALIPLFLREIDRGADFVIGSRYIKDGSIPYDWAIHRKIFSLLGNIVIRIGFMTFSIRDWTSGFRAIKADFVKDVLENLNNYSGYVFQVALLDKAKKRGLKIVEVPLKFIDRKIGKSKINSIQYILNTFFYVFTNSSFIKYFIVGALGAIIDFGLSYIFIVKFLYKIWFSTVISAEVAIVSNFILNNFWSFSHKKINFSLLSYLSSFLKFNLIAVGAILIQAVSLEILTNQTSRDYWYIYKVLILAFLIIPYSYFMYNYFIWREKSKK